MKTDPEKGDLRKSDETDEDEEFQFFVVRKDEPQHKKDGSFHPRSCKPVVKEDRIMETETGT
jgi:hypothetical protein